MSAQENNNGTPFKGIVKGLVFLVTLGVLVWLARRAGLEDMVRDTGWFQEHVLGRGPTSVLVFIVFTTLFTAVGLPRQLTAFLGGMVFGWLAGSVLCTLGYGLGCWLASGYARLMGREVVSRLFGKRVAAVDAFLCRSPFRMSLAVRLFPLGSNLATNLAAGVSSIPLVPFVLGSGLGAYPQSLVFALFGGGLSAESDLGMYVSVGVSVALLVASTWLGVSLYRRHRAEMRACQAESDSSS